MNILIIVPRMNIGGAESHVAMLAPLLKNKNHNVIIASGGGKLAQKLAADNIRQLYLPIRLSTSFAAFRLKHIIKKYHIDIIHAHSGAAGIAAMKYKQQYNPAMPVIYTAHGLFGGNEKEKILLQCDKIIAVSRCVHDTAIENGCSPAKVTIIYNGIDTAKFIPQNNRNLLRQEYNIPTDAFCLAIVARMKNLRNKGHQHLFDIFTDYAEKENWHLLAIGTGKAKWRFRYLLWKNNLNTKIHFLGHKADVENYLAAADSVVLPSRFETFGLVLAEGMSMEKPAIAYNVGGTSEVITPNQTGFLIPYGDKKKFYDKIKLLADNYKLCQKMGQAARIDIINRFSPEKMLTELIAVYKECLHQKKDTLN